MFELVSAYGTVGLSLGIPTQNYSFSGALSTLSKFIIILVMLRGRHRGLPVAIDRAVLLKGYDFPDGGGAAAGEVEMMEAAAARERDGTNGTDRTAVSTSANGHPHQHGHDHGHPLRKVVDEVCDREWHDPKDEAIAKRLMEEDGEVKRGRSGSTSLDAVPETGTGSTTTPERGAEKALAVDGEVGMDSEKHRGEPSPES